MTTVKLGYRTHNRQHWSEVRTRGTSTGDPCLFRYTNGLLAELKIQTVYDRNTRRRIIKVYAGIATLDFARNPSAKAKKCKNDVADTLGFEPATLGARAPCASPLDQSAYGMAVYIRPKHQSSDALVNLILNGDALLILAHIDVSRHKRQTQYSSINPSQLLTSWQATAGWSALTR